MKHEEFDYYSSLKQIDLNDLFKSARMVTKTTTKNQETQNQAIEKGHNMFRNENSPLNGIDLTLFDNLLSNGSNVNSNIKPNSLNLHRNSMSHNKQIENILKALPSSAKTRKTKITFELGDIDNIGEIGEDILNILDNDIFLQDNLPKFDYPPFVADYFLITRRMPNDILVARFLDVNLLELEVDVYIKLYKPWNELEFRENFVIYLNAKYNYQFGFYEVHGEAFIDIELEKKGKILYSYLIVHPHMLLTPSAIKISYPCARKAYFDLEYYLLYRITLTMEILIGLVAHSVLEDLFNDQVGQRDIDKTIDISNIISKVQLYKSKRIFDLAMLQKYEVDEIDRAFDDLAGKIFHFWTNTFKNYNCKVDGGIITKILASERKVFNSELGIKGIIDCEINFAQGGKLSNEIHIAGELKSGYEKKEDERQLSLYCMLLTKELEDTNNDYSDENNPIHLKDFEDIKIGFLVYLKTGKCDVREFKRHFCVHLLKSRNEVACLLRVKSY
jgi:hypothetical protein